MFMPLNHECSYPLRRPFYLIMLTALISDDLT